MAIVVQSNDDGEMPEEIHGWIECEHTRARERGVKIFKYGALTMTGILVYEETKEERLQ